LAVAAWVGGGAAVVVVVVVVALVVSVALSSAWPTEEQQGQ
jgi:hypothetical protein